MAACHASSPRRQIPRFPAPLGSRTYVFPWGLNIGISTVFAESLVSSPEGQESLAEILKVLWQMQWLQTAANNPLAGAQRLLDDWDGAFHWDVRFIQGHTGMTNLGTMCYMRSAIQMCFMSPLFRRAVLEVEPREWSHAESLGDE